MNEHLKVEINEKYNFKTITCDEGHYITAWDRENIADFSASKIMVAPMNTDLSLFYCITDEEYSELEMKQFEYFEGEHKREDVE